MRDSLTYMGQSVHSANDTALLPVIGVLVVISVVLTFIFARITFSKSK